MKGIERLLDRLWRDQRRRRDWVDQQRAADDAAAREWRRIEAEVLEIIDVDFGRTARVADSLLERDDADGAGRTWAAWGTRSAPRLARLADRWRAIAVPYTLVEPDAYRGWLDLKADAAAAVDTIAVGARLRQTGMDGAQATVERGIDLWTAAFERAVELAATQQMDADEQRV